MNSNINIGWCSRILGDPRTGDEVKLTPEDPFSGLNKLLKSLEELSCKTALDRRGEVRSSIYLDLKRKPNERLANFCTRFRSLLAELRQEGVQLPSAELGWFLKGQTRLR